MIHANILSTIGNTPLVRLGKIKQKYNLVADIAANSTVVGMKAMDISKK